MTLCTVDGQDCINWLLKYEGYSSYKVYWMIHMLMRKKLGLLAVDKYIGGVQVMSLVPGKV